jgi:hypothetical protein
MLPKVAVKPDVLAQRNDLKSYIGQVGVQLWSLGDGFAVIFWRGLSCSSVWNLNQLNEVK